MKKTFLGLVLASSLLVGATAVNANLINGGFETPHAANQNTYLNLDLDSLSPEERTFFGWKTTSTDNVIEIWPAGFSNNGSVFKLGGNNLGYGFLPDEGDQFAELNGTQESALYQDVIGIAADATIGWSFAHRGRLGDDTIKLSIIDLGLDSIYQVTDFVLFSGQFTTGTDAWKTYSGYDLIASGNNYRFQWTSVSADGGYSTYGNFLDDAKFGVDVKPAPEPATLLLFGAGLAGFMGLRVRRKH